VTAEIDLAEVEKTRNLYPYLRDRRPELYGRLVGPAVYHSASQLG